MRHSPSRPKGESKLTSLIKDLLELERREDRAALAALRRGLGKEPGTAGEMYPFVLPRLPTSEKEDAYERGWSWRQKCHFIVASLFAWHPVQLTTGERWQRNFGASIARLKQDREGMEAGVERRFVALLNAEPEDLPDHLRTMVGLLKANDIGVDWEMLLTDLQGWSRSGRPVQTKWAKAFWRPFDEQNDNEPPGESED